MCIDTVTRPLEDPLPAYQPIKRHSDFEEYLVPDSDNPSYYWNTHTYNYLVHSLLVVSTNDTCVKYFMELQACKVVKTHAHEISGWTILSRLLHACPTNIIGMNGYVQSVLSTLV